MRSSSDGDPGGAAAAAAGPAGGVLRPGVVAVPGPELRVRAGDDQASGRAVSPAAGRGPAGRAAGSRGLGGCRAGPPVAAAEHLLAVPGRGKLGADPLRDAVRAGRRPGGGGWRGGGVLLRAAGDFHRRLDLGPAGQPGERRVLRPALDRARGGAFPQVRWVAAAESGTGALTGAAFGPYRTGGADAGLMTCCPASAPGCWCWRTGISCPGPGPRRAGHRGAHPVARLGELFAQPVKVLADGTYLAELKPARKADGHRSRSGSSSTPCIPRPRRRRRGVLGGFLPGHRSARHRGVPGAGPGLPYPARWGCETVIGHHKTDMGEGQPVLRSKDPEGVAQEMWALFAVYQAICQLIGTAVKAWASRRNGSASRMPWPPRPTPSRLSPPDQLDLALATFLLKILHARLLRPRPPGPRQPPERPGRPATSPPANPASPPSPPSPDESSSTCSTPNYLKARPLAYGAARREDPRDMAKAGLPESQSPEGVRSPPPERRL